MVKMNGLECLQANFPAYYPPPSTIRASSINSDLTDVWRCNDDANWWYKLVEARVFAEDPNGIAESFLGLRPNGRISDFEYLVEIWTIPLLGGGDAKEIIINSIDNTSALSWAVVEF